MLRAGRNGAAAGHALCYQAARGFQDPDPYRRRLRGPGRRRRGLPRVHVPQRGQDRRRPQGGRGHQGRRREGPRRRRPRRPRRRDARRPARRADLPRRARQRPRVGDRHRARAGRRPARPGRLPGGAGGAQGRPARADRSAPVPDPAPQGRGGARARPRAARRRASATSSATGRCVKDGLIAQQQVDDQQALGRGQLAGDRCGATRRRSTTAKLNARLRAHHLADRRRHGRAPGRPGQHRPRRRPDGHRRASRSSIRSPSSSRCRRTICRAIAKAARRGRRSPSRRCSRDGATALGDRAARAHRQPDQPGDGDDAPQGDLRRTRPRALAEPVREGAAAARDAQGRARRPRPSRCSAGRRARSSTSSAPTTRPSVRPVSVDADRGRPAIVASGLAAGEQVVRRGAEPAAAGGKVVAASRLEAKPAPAQATAGAPAAGAGRGRRGGKHRRRREARE